jgi:hypothetical protein
VLPTGLGGAHHSEDEKYVSAVYAMLEEPIDIQRVMEVYRELASERAGG